MSNSVIIGTVFAATTVSKIALDDKTIEPPKESFTFTDGTELECSTLLRAGKPIGEVSQVRHLFLSCFSFWISGPTDREIMIYVSFVTNTIRM